MQMNAVSNVSLPFALKEHTQLTIQSVFNMASNKAIDEAIAQCIYGDNLSLRLVESPLFNKMLQLMRNAPASYKLPTRKRLAGSPTPSMHVSSSCIS